MNDLASADHGASPFDDERALGIAELVRPLQRQWRSWALSTMAAGAIGAGGSYLITPQFTSETTFLPPQQQQSAAAAALSSLGSLAGLAGISAVRSPADQYISLMQSWNATDRMIDRFDLIHVYKKKYRKDARKALLSATQMTLGKKDGLITVSVEDEDPRRAAAMANQFVEELRRLTSTLAVSEAQQRRVFFEKQLQDVKAKLVQAQSALQQSGFTAGAIKAAPQAVAEQYAQLRAQATAAEVKLETLRASMAESSIQVHEQAATLEALRAKLRQLESATSQEQGDPDYVGKYREFKYEEALFDIMSKEYELARVDESREGALIQVVDVARPAEQKSSPKRAVMSLACAFIGAIASGLWFIWRARPQSAN
jgi:uncharacterized protein involved in exopolysaccharide biosynthesis